MKKIILFILVLCVCFTTFGAAFAEEAAENGIVLNDGTPWVDYSLRENIALVEQKPDSPKDDFYLWVNYDWLRSAEIAREPRVPTLSAPLRKKSLISAWNF
jgi:hypothetical protein